MISVSICWQKVKEMSSTPQHFLDICRSLDIAAYIDGELSDADEKQVEAHLASCSMCANELNEHKSFLNFLDHSFDDDGGIDLPADFTRKIVTTAESGVNGLRDQSEYRNAIVILGALMVLVLSILLATGKVGLMLETIGVVERLSALFGAIGQLIYSIGLSFSVVVKTLTTDVPLGLTLLLFFSFGLTILFLLTLLFRARREKNI